MTTARAVSAFEGRRGIVKRLFAAAIALCFQFGSVLFAQTPTISRVVDAASFKTQLAPGSLANVVGTNFGSSTAISVTVGGKACAVLSAAPTQLQIQIAVDAPLGPTTLQVVNSAPFNISLTQYAPILYSADDTGQGDAQAYHGNGAAVTISSPANAGEVLLILAIGMGPTVPTVPTGAVSPSNPPAVITTALTMILADKAAVVLFAGLVPGKTGVYQINFLMPADTTTGDQPISFTIGGVGSNILTLPTSDAPVISGLQNNYSYTMAGLPNYGIAQGAIFNIYGSNLTSSSSTLSQSNYPLPTLLDGVSVSVTVNGTTTHPILYYVSRTQLGAILPSNTPLGTGQITVTKNGETGPAASIQVVESAFGILTMNQAGSGPAAALDVNYDYLGITNSIHPGEYVNLWGSGLGPAAGDETNPQIPVDLANIPIEVDIGGISATVTYHGRSIYPGLDQIQAIVPTSAQPGCNVSVVVRTGNVYSNFATIPVAVSGRTCSEPELGITSDQLQSVYSKPSLTFGTVNFQKDVNGIPQAVPQDRASAQFSRSLTPQFSAANLGNVSIGSCTVYYTGFFGGDSSDALDAGPMIDISSPMGKATLDPSGDNDGRYDEFLGSDTTLPVFIPTADGTLIFDNGTGGADVGAFTANLTLGAPLVWLNEAAITTVNRSNGVTVNWAGGAANSYVQISGMSVARSGPLVVLNAFFTCAAPVTANQFTVPPAVLLALPPGTGAPPFGTLSVSNTTGQQFMAPGLDFGLVTASVNFVSTGVTYQ